MPVRVRHFSLVCELRNTRYVGNEARGGTALARALLRAQPMAQLAQHAFFPKHQGVERAMLPRQVHVSLRQKVHQT